MGKKQTPIFRKLFTTFSAFALIPVICIGVLSLFVFSRMTYRNLENNITDSLDQMSMLIDGKLEEMKYISENFISNSELKRLLRMPMTDETILLLNAELEKVNSMNMQRGYLVTIFGINGQIYLNWLSDGMIYRDPLVQRIKEMDWYPELEGARSLPVWIPHMDNIAGPEQQSRTVLALARNIVNDSLEGEAILGFAVISVPSSRLSDLLKSTSECTYVVDGDNRIIMSQDDEEVGQFLETVQLGVSGIQRSELDGTAYMVGVRANEMGGLYTVVLIPEEELRWQLLVSIALIGLSIALSVGIIFIVAYVMSKSISKPILTLDASMREVQEGELLQKEIITEITELKSLADNFNIMVDRIRLLIAEKVGEEQKRKEIEVEKANAEFKFLRAQITPHFLFNTLNSIKWLAVLHGATPVEEMITALGRLLECSMQKGNDFLSLSEELDNVKAYLKIQEMRYGSRLKSNYEVEEGIGSVTLPKLVLQPLVENGIIHGIDKNQDGGLITIRVYSEGEKVFAEVEDDGPGLPEAVLDLLTEKCEGKDLRLSGIGISNVDKRIRLIYGEDCGLFYKKGKGGKGTVAVLVFGRRQGEGTC